MFVYMRSEPGLYTVGHYGPNGQWIAESDHRREEDAADRVHWLNGGNHSLEQRVIELEKAQSLVQQHDEYVTERKRQYERAFGSKT